jgi:uncharacterized membrane protein HdeD (DUF308 family)
MISQVISVQRRRVYGFPVAEAHHLLYFLLFAVDALLIVGTVFQLNPGMVTIPLTVVIGAIFLAFGIGFLYMTYKSWTHRDKPKLAEETGDLEET